MEHLDVLIVGAGISGVGAAYYLQRDHPGRTFAILEARGATGGTWDLFRYPGIRSDSDLHTFGYEFRPWTADQSIAQAPAILDYVRQTASEHGIDGKVRLHHKVVSASWSTDHARWTVDVERTDTGERTQLGATWLFCAGGYYRYDQGYTPHFEGRERFEGAIVHPQHWPDDLDWAGKRVVVIGSGATAVTLVPAMAETAAHVTMLQRTPSYVLPVPTVDPLTRLARKLLPPDQAHALMRRKNIVQQRAVWWFCQRFPHTARRLIRWLNVQQLPDGYPVDEHFNPPYDPWDQRLCIVPDGDLFRSIREGNASVVTEHVDTFTEKGVLLKSGRELDADVIVTATGLNLLPFGGIALTVDGERGPSARHVHVQRVDAQRRAQLLRRHRLHERVVDAQNRPALHPLVAPAQLHGRARLHHLPPYRGRPRHADAPAPRLRSGLRSAVHRRASQAGRPLSVAHARRLPDRLQDAWNRTRGRRAPALFERDRGSGEMSRLAGKVAVVTGAGSGIGRALAMELARRGARLALSDIDEASLAETADQASAIVADVHAATLDVSDEAAFGDYAQSVADRFGVVHQLYNNAGIGGLARPLTSLDMGDFERVLGVNLWGVIHGTRAFMPHLIASGDGHVIALSSLNGFMGQAYMTAYCASKFGVRGFAEALRAEMRAERHPVRVTVVHPGGVQTNISNAALARTVGLTAAEQRRAEHRTQIYNEKLFRTTPERAAHVIVSGVEAGRGRILVGGDARAVDLGVRLFPTFYSRVVAWWERRMFGEAS